MGCGPVGGERRGIHGVGERGHGRGVGEEWEKRRVAHVGGGEEGCPWVRGRGGVPMG